MSDTSLLVTGLAFLVPLGFALIAVGGLAEEHARHAALSLVAALGLAALGYLAIGFALQFGGVGLLYNQPGLEELVWEWSALGPTWGPGWGMAGLAGWGMAGPGATPGAYALALANLPWVSTAAMIPLLSLRSRIPAWASGLMGLLNGALVYPLAGNWIWGGGWLANLGTNLGLGHGLVDVSGAGLVHLLGASATLAGLLVFLPRRPRPTAAQEPMPLPPVHMPLLAVFGAGLLLVGSTAWMIANPLLDRRSLVLSQAALAVILAAAGGSLLPLLYTWFVTGRPDALMTTRGLAAGTIVGAAIGPFAPPWAAFAAGAATGLLVPFAIYLVERVLRVDDPTAALSVHGLAGCLGLLALAILADGRAGLGWNGVGSSAYLGVARQGVTGLWPAAGFQSDFPSQLQAQVIGLVTLGLFGFFMAWAFTAPPAILVQFLQQRQLGQLPAFPRPLRVLRPLRADPPPEEYWPAEESAVDEGAWPEDADGEVAEEEELDELVEEEDFDELDEEEPLDDELPVKR